MSRFSCAKAARCAQRVSSFIDGDEDHTGNYVWPSSYVLAKWLSSNAAETQGKTVLELGSGCGLAGLTVAAMGAAKEVILTDLLIRHAFQSGAQRGAAG